MLLRTLKENTTQTVNATTSNTNEGICWLIIPEHTEIDDFKSTQQSTTEKQFY